MGKYSYCGPVMEFEKCVAYKWQAETIACSDKKALSNLAYRFKKETNRSQNSKIRLTGKLELLNANEN